MSAPRILPDHMLTPLGRRSRRSIACFDEYGIHFDELALLLATIARHRHGLTTRRCDVLEFLAEEGDVGVKCGFETLRKKGLVKMVSKHVNEGTWIPSPLAIAKFNWCGRESVIGAAE